MPYLYKEQKEQWIEALRSGEYQQGQKFLHANDRYCCLGVLCDLFQKAHPEKDHHWGNRTGDIFHFHEELNYPPMEVRLWAGLDDTTMEKLVQQNDTLGYTFGQIAAWIEMATGSI
jgi:hypothetical protein